MRKTTIVSFAVIAAAFAGIALVFEASAYASAYIRIGAALIALAAAISSGIELRRPDYFRGRVRPIPLAIMAGLAALSMLIYIGLQIAS